MKGILCQIGSGTAKLVINSFSALMLLVCVWTTLARPALAQDLAVLEATDLKRSHHNWIILDARPGSSWQAGHIPGALSFSWTDYTKTDESGTPYRVWPPQELAAALGERGIDENTPIVVYGDADKSWGGEGWTCWVLTWLGHQGAIRLLAGGIQSWRSQGFSVITGPEKGPKPAAHYRFSLMSEVDVQAPELKERGSLITLIDTRSSLEWLQGHLAGAIHIHWTEFYTGKDHRPLGPDALRKLLQDHDVDTHKPVVYYCTGGVRSAYAWMVHQLSGLRPARNYEGGMEDWTRQSTKQDRTAESTPKHQPEIPRS
jgi:thiosulfate/3-mercaptopyruvate sulfurtransferase